jgi:two-component sensor histidine kinase/ligand-binding sensor domain-containing protein
MSRHATIFALYFYIITLFCFPQSLSIKHFTNNDGLSLSENHCLFQDSRGFIWIGANGGGVDVYNGKSFTNFSVDVGLHDIVINSIAEDNLGNIWLASPNKGLSVYDGLNLTIRNKQNFRSNKINKIVNTIHNDLWALTKSGIIAIHNNEMSQLLIEKKNVLTGDYKDLTILSKQRMALYTENKLIILNAQQKNIRIETEIDFDLVITKILEYSTSQLVLAAKDGNIYLYNLLDKSLKLMTQINKTDNYYFSLDHLVKWKNKYLAGTYGNGIFEISSDLKTTKRFKISNEKTNEYSIISDILIDFNNNLWITAMGEGLYYLKSSQIKMFLEGMAASSDIFFLAKKEKHVIATSFEKGLFAVDNEGEERLLLAKENSSNYVGLQSLDNGMTYCFMGKKLFTYNEQQQTLTPVDISKINKEYLILDVKAGPSNTLYLFTSIGIFDITNPKNIIEIYTSKPKENIQATMVTSKNHIWFSTESKNYIINSNGEVKEFNLLEERCSESAVGFMEDNLGHIWIFTNQCLAKYDGQRLEFIDNKKLYNRLHYSGLYSKANNSLWLGTNDGVIEVKLDNKGNIHETILYDSKVGFTAKECNQFGIFEEAGGKKIWVSTVNGIVSISKERFAEDTTMPRLGIVDLKILLDDNEIKTHSSGKSKWFHIPENLELPYNKNHIAIGFSGIQYVNPESIKYRYKLNGYDTGYSTPTNYNYASYTNLPPGKYTLSVIANNNIGQWTQKPLVFKFSVERPYWKTWWFYTLISLSTIAVASFYYYYRKRQVVILEKRLEEEVSKRTLVLKKQNEKIEILIKEIHHRVKNNLQVITSLINLHSGYVKDTKALEVFEESKNRIKSMALVHEKLYETNDLSSISVDDFILKMFNYLKDIYDETGETILEKNIAVEKLDIDTVIPLGLLVNEIFSNAFKYGLKDNPLKKISVSMKQIKDKQFEMILSDSGKGFNYEIKRGSKTSFGLELIDLLVNQLNGKITVNTKLKTEYRIQFESIGRNAVSE